MLVVVYLIVEVDWAAPANLYRGYRQAQKIMEPAHANGKLLKQLKAEFGDNVSFDYAVAFDQAGAVTRTLHVTRSCGAMDNKPFVLAVARRVHEQGFEWPEKIEYEYACELSKPQSLGLGPQLFGKALDRHLREQADCTDARLGAYSPGQPFAVQSLFVPHGSADMQLYVGASGDIEKVHLVAWDQFTEKEQQIHAMLCATQALLLTVQPEEDTQALRTEIDHVWHTGQNEVTAVVGPYQVTAKGAPMAMTLLPRQ